MAGAKEDQLLGGYVYTILDKIEADVSSYKEMELEMDRLTPRILHQKDSSHKWQFCTKACASPRLVYQVQDMSGQNINIKYLMCQIPIKILEHKITNI